MASWDFLSKFVLVGDVSTGKSSLLVQLTDQRFLADPDPTVGVEFGSYIVDIPETSERIKCQCWDTAGSEAFRSITRSYYRGAAGALLVYSIAHRPSFLHIADWLRDIREHAEENVSIILVGNMSDLCSAEDAKEAETAAEASRNAAEAEAAAETNVTSDPDSAAAEAPEPTQRKRTSARRRQVTREEAEAFAKKENIMFVETSAKTGENVEEAFRRAARDIHAKFRESSHDTSRAGLTSSGSSRPGVIAASLEGRDQSSRGDGRCCVIS